MAEWIQRKLQRIAPRRLLNGETFDSLAEAKVVIKHGGGISTPSVRAAAWDTDPRPRKRLYRNVRPLVHFAPPRQDMASVTKID